MQINSFKMIWEEESSGGETSYLTFMQAKNAAISKMRLWIRDEKLSHPENIFEWSKKDISSWESMLTTNTVRVEKIDLTDNQVVSCWLPTPRTDELVGWISYRRLKSAEKRRLANTNVKE